MVEKKTRKEIGVRQYKSWFKRNHIDSFSPQEIKVLKEREIDRIIGEASLLPNKLITAFERMLKKAYKGPHLKLAEIYLDHFFPDWAMRMARTGEQYAKYGFQSFRSWLNKDIRNYQSGMLEKWPNEDVPEGCCIRCGMQLLPGSNLELRPYGPVRHDCISG